MVMIFDDFFGNAEDAEGYDFDDFFGDAENAEGYDF